MLFLLSKYVLCMWISAHPFVLNDIFSTLHMSCGYEILLTCTWFTRNKNLKFYNPYLLYKMVFLASKTLLYLLSTWKKTYFNFEPYDLANGMNVRFGRHIKYKLVTRSYCWKYKKKPQFCTICLAFKKGCFEAVLDSTRVMMFRG
jgi:hypothetical protein